MSPESSTISQLPGSIGKMSSTASPVDLYILFYFWERPNPSGATDGQRSVRRVFFWTECLANGLAETIQQAWGDWQWNLQSLEAFKSRAELRL